LGFWKIVVDIKFTDKNGIPACCGQAKSVSLLIKEAKNYG